MMPLSDDTMVTGFVITDHHLAADSIRAIEYGWLVMVKSKIIVGGHSFQGGIQFICDFSHTCFCFSLSFGKLGVFQRIILLKSALHTLFWLYYVVWGKPIERFL